MTATTDLQLTGHSIVAGEPTPGTAGEITAIDPATGQTLEPTWSALTPADVERATRAAADAAEEYAALAPAARAAFLRTVADRIEALGETLIARAVAESGLPVARLTGELGRTTGQLRLFATVVEQGDHLQARIDPALPDRTPLPRPDLRQLHVATGPVAVFGASNFPLAFSTAGGDTAAALAAGCPVVVKAHNAHPGAAELVGRAVSDAVAEHGLPAGVFSLVYGVGNDVGQALVTDPRITAVGFTGSRAGGLALVAAAAARPVPIPVYAEMSSINPVLVFPGGLGDPAALATGYVGSLTLGSGQFCTNPGLLLLPEGPDGDAFLAAAAERVAAATGTTMLTPGIAGAYRDGSTALGSATGVTTVGTGSPGSGPHAPAPVVLATDAGDFTGRPELQAEVFGALGLVVRYRTTAELLAVLGDLEGQLTATVHAGAGDHEALRPVLPVLQARVGRVLFGGWPTGVEVSHAMVHGGPFPATSDGRSTSVGTLAVQRFLRPVCFQDAPDELLPPALQRANPWGLSRRVDGVVRRPEEQ